jgi:hypothetical protein
MWMTDGRCKLPFAEKTHAVVGLLQTPSQQFQREAASGLKALGFVDFAHASASQQTADAVWPPGLTGSQPRFACTGHP